MASDDILREWHDRRLCERIEAATLAGQDERVAHLQYLRLSNALRGWKLQPTPARERHEARRRARVAVNAYERSLR